METKNDKQKVERVYTPTIKYSYEVVSPGMLMIRQTGPGQCSAAQFSNVKKPEISPFLCSYFLSEFYSLKVELMNLIWFFITTRYYKVGAQYCTCQPISADC
jgi:hypothetical protein